MKKLSLSKDTKAVLKFIGHVLIWMAVAPAILAAASFAGIA